jgi:hydroxymethylglutaryl-CoA reductase (NADPH)
MNIRAHPSVAARRRALEGETKVALSAIGAFTLDEEAASAKNCENMVGAAQIPLGIAGPLVLENLQSERQRVYLPLATTEGALIASVARGCKAVALAGGATVDSYRVGTTRGPVFEVENLAANDALDAFLKSDFKVLATVAKKTSGHLTLTKILSRGVGRNRFVRFVFDCQDAMGMNMATLAAQELCSYIEKKTGATTIAVAGNFDVDKKPSWLNVIEGRGTKVWAEVVIPASVCRDVLKTTPQAVFDVWLAKCMMGSVISGTIGANAHIANVVAALFLATGQDPAHVVEAACGITTAQVTSKGDLYISVYIPDLMVGTVGGGTTLATQKEALSLLGVAGGNHGKNARRLAEIVAGAALAGELSLLASLAQGTLASAHKKLARGGK